MAIHITARPDYVYEPPTPPARPSIFIQRNPDYKPINLHTMAAQGSGLSLSIDADWCPICHSPKEHISERLVRGRPMWHCDVCEHEW